MAGISSSSSAADAEPAGHGGDDEDGASPLLNALRKLPDLCVEKELHDLTSATVGLADARHVSQRFEPGAYTRPLLSST